MRILEIPWITCEINPSITGFAYCFSVAGTVTNLLPTFAMTDAKIYVAVLTLSSQGNAKLLEQLKSSFKRTNNWNKYQSKRKAEARNQYLDYLINSNFQGVNRFFIS